METTEELRKHLSQVLKNLHSAVDASVSIRSRSREDAKNVAMLWEEFLGNFISYIMQKGKETGQNLLSDISFHKIWRR